MSDTAGEYWRFRRLRRLGMNAASWTSRAEALERLSDFVRREGRRPTAEPSVQWLRSQWDACWYASVETSEIPSDQTPFPRIHVLRGFRGRL